MLRLFSALLSALCVVTVVTMPSGASAELICGLNDGYWYDAVWQPGDSEQVLETRMTLSQFVSSHEEYSRDGWRLQAMASYKKNCSEQEIILFDALWNYEPDVEETYVLGDTKSDFQATNIALREDGWRLNMVDTYMTANGVRYNATWRLSNAAQVDVSSWAFESFMAKAKEKRAAGWQMVYLDAYRQTDGTPRYNASWRKTGAVDTSYFMWAFEDFEPKYESMRAAGYNLWSDSIVGWSEGRRHNAMFFKTKRDEVRKVLVSSGTLKKAQATMHAQGYNMVFFEPHYDGSVAP